MDDLFKTIDSDSEETLFKDRASKFYGYAFPVQSEAQINENLDKLKKMHSSAGHYCYAWQLGTDQPVYRVNDDGEPNNSAGMPIYGQIQSFELTNVLVVSVRYFGGTKLGVGGLINAYRTSAKLTLESCNIVEKTMNQQLVLNFGYDLMSKVMKIIREHSLKIDSQTMEMNCEFMISVRKSEAEKIYQIFESLYPLEIKYLEV